MIWRKLRCSLLCSFLPCHSWCRHRQTSTGKTYICIYIYMCVCCRCIANQILSLSIYILLLLWLLLLSLLLLVVVVLLLLCIYAYVCMSYYFLPNCICYSDIMFAHVTATQRRKQRHIIRVQVSSHVEPWHPMQLMDTPVMMSVPPGHFRCLLQMWGEWMSKVPLNNWNTWPAEYKTTDLPKRSNCCTIVGIWFWLSVSPTTCSSLAKPNDSRWLNHSNPNLCNH